MFQRRILNFFADQTFLAMKGGILEVLVVNAQDIKPHNLLGKPAYYVVIQCGTEVRRSKITKGYHHQAYWNQKFKFELPISEWMNVTRLEICIMDDESFNEPGFVGRTIITLDGIIAEGNDKGHIELHPSPYNVVLEDTTYKGQIKIGLTYTIDDGYREMEENTGKVIRTGYNVYTSLFRILKISWWRVLFPYGQY